ncbi:MAG TPA: NAD(P)-dependent oxidoreductase [Thermodesulfovibrionales bacterium]|nr:NAD(P)-dependent oxidoreductase [Thermodesulfovibrionales bacterium]
MMKALVTGATGFIGSHLCEKLVEKGYDVTCLSRNTSNLKWIENLGVRIVKGDCTDLESLRGLQDNFDYVFHLAGLTKSVSEEEFFLINAKGTENLMQALVDKSARLRRFVYLSSLAAAGPGLTMSPLREDCNPSPVSSYGRSKLAGERAVLRLKDTIPVSILRPPAVYGPRDRDMLMIFKMAKKGFFFDLGKCYYSLLYVEDLVRGIILCAESKLAEGRVYFLSDNNIYSGERIALEVSSALETKTTPLRVPKCVMPFFAYIGEKLNSRGIINRDRIKDFQHAYWICDSTKAREEIGFIPKVGLKEGIKWTADWYRIHRWL